MSAGDGALTKPNFATCIVKQVHDACARRAAEGACKSAWLPRVGLRRRRVLPGTRAREDHAARTPICTTMQHPDCEGIGSRASDDHGEWAEDRADEVARRRHCRRTPLPLGAVRPASLRGCFPWRLFEISAAVRDVFRIGLQDGEGVRPATRLRRGLGHDGRERDADETGEGGWRHHLRHAGLQLGRAEGGGHGRWVDCGHVPLDEFTVVVQPSRGLEGQLRWTFPPTKPRRPGGMNSASTAAR